MTKSLEHKYFSEIDHEIISTPILIPSADSRTVVVSYKCKSCVGMGFPAWVEPALSRG